MFLVDKERYPLTAVILHFPAMPRSSDPLPNRIREQRKARGLTLKQLGPLINLHFTAVGKLERGESALTQYWMEKIAEALQVQPADLLPVAEGGLTADERQLVDTYREIPAPLRETFDALRERHQKYRGAPEVVPLPDRHSA